MPTITTVEPPRLYPTFRYREASAMIDWLCDTFGFTIHARYMDGDKVAHAQLAFGSSMIMVGEARDDDYGGIVGAPGENGGKSLYIAVDDVDALYTRVSKVQGATILEEPTDRSYGSREFLCRDPQGNVWAFGIYWPKAHERAE